MDIEQYIPTEVAKQIEGGSLLKNLLQDCKEKHTESSVCNVQYSKGNCTFELVESTYCGVCIVPCASFLIECVGVTKIKQEMVGDIDLGYHADIKFSIKKMPDRVLISFAYIHNWTENNLFFVEAGKMRLVKYEKQDY